MDHQQEVVACWLLNIETIEDFPSLSITLVLTRILPLRFPPFNPFGTETGGAIVLQKIEIKLANRLNIKPQPTLIICERLVASPLIRTETVAVVDEEAVRWPSQVKVEGEFWAW